MFQWRFRFFIRIETVSVNLALPRHRHMEALLIDVLAVAGIEPVQQLMKLLCTITLPRSKIGATGPIRTGKGYSLLRRTVVPASLIHSGIQRTTSIMLTSYHTILKLSTSFFKNLVPVKGIAPPRTWDFKSHASAISLSSTRALFRRRQFVFQQIPSFLKLFCNQTILSNVAS